MFNNINSKFVNWAFILLCCFLTILTLEGIKKYNYIGKEIYPQRTIQASGDGEAYAIPDIATFSFSAVESDKTVKDAQAKVDTKVNNALDVLKTAGIDEKDIQTTDYNVYPKYEWNQTVCPANIPCSGGRNVLTGYEVSETITVKVRDTSKAGDLVTKIGALAVSNISGLNFTVDDKDKFVAQAREQAIAKAKANAQKLADDLGVSLGKLLYFNENGNYPVPYAAEGMGGGADMKAQSVAPTVAALPQGQTKITSNVSITYEIK